MLAPGTIIGIACGAAVFVFVTVSFGIIVSVRWKHRRSQITVQRRWSVYPGGNTDIDGQSYVSLPETQTIHRTWQRPVVRSPSKRRPALPWRDQPYNIQPHPTRSNSKRPSASRPKTHHRRRLSWPLPSRRMSRRARSLRHVQATKLSPITESPIPRSVSTPEIRPALGNRFASHRPNIYASHDCFQPFSYANGSSIDRFSPAGYNANTPVQRRGQLGSRGDAQLLYSKPHPESKGTRASIDAVTLSQVRAENDFCASPSRDRMGSRAGSLRASSSVAAGQAERSSHRRFGSVNHRHRRTASSSIVQPWPELASSGDMTRGAFYLVNDCTSQNETLFPFEGMSLDSGSSPRSSQASDDLHHRDNFELGMPVSTGLTSPSKRQKSSAGYGRNASAGSVFNSTDAASAGISQGVQRIQNSRCISLETVGGRASHRASSAISEHTQEEERRRDSYRLLDTVKTLRPSISHRNHSLPLMSDASSDTHTANEALPTVPYDRQSRHSTALQIISGNHSDPFQIRRRSRELVLDACEQKWDQKLAPPPSKPVSALKGASGRSRYHRRQNCVRISALAPVVYGINARSSMSEKSEAAEPGLLSQPRTPSPGNSPSRSPTRPPSVMDFCPQISPARPGTSHADFAVMPSPTQPSSSFCPSPISDNETVIPWTPQSNFNRLSTGSSIFSTPPRADLSRPNTPIPNFPLPASSSPSPRPSTTTTLRTVRPLSTALFPPPTFPAPVPPQLTRPRRQSTLHGPRSPPPRTSPAKEIRRSILALRRMNSDVSDWESTSRTSSKRYLSLGAAPESWEVSGLREVVEESEDMGPSKPLPGNAVRVDGSDATATALAKLVAEKEVGGEMAFELPVLRVGKRRERNSVHGEELYDAGGFLRE